jgi:hypothetical protein
MAGSAHPLSCALFSSSQPLGIVARRKAPAWAGAICRPERLCLVPWPFTVANDLTYPVSFRLGAASPAVGQCAYLRLYLCGGTLA